MARYVFGTSVKGATHVRNNTPCQDSYKIEEISPELTIVAVADGHGSEKSPKSKNGSTIAVNVFCKIMKQFIQEYEDSVGDLATYFNREGQIKFGQRVCMEWQRRVQESYERSKQAKPLNDDGTVNWGEIYRLYGTTLLGLLITSSYVFAFQIGDGDMMLVDEELVSTVVESEKILGTETHSLSKVDAWKKAVFAVRRKDIDEGKPYLYMLSTDGMSNSFVSDEAFKKTCREYYDMIKEHGYEKVSENLSNWLSETSELGCGDDITLLMVYVD